jgi:hypothetical protein
MRSRVIVAALAISLLMATPALGATYTVTGFGDSPDPPSACQAIQPELYQCDLLRRAVLEANASPATDVIVLAGGTYTLTADQLALSQDVAITGAGARSTVVQAAPSSRVFELTGTANVQLTNLTIQGGAPVTGEGGNVLVGAGTTLSLVLARVTAGNASNGGGIANAGTVSIQNSLVDTNRAISGGGGIYNVGSSAAADLIVIASTIASNTANEQGGGILSSGNTSNSVQLLGSTVAHNTLSGIALSQPQNATTYGSIIADNGSTNCQGSFSSGQMNVESSSGCLPPGDGNLANTDPLLASTLSNQGGQTDVLAIPASSPAVDHVVPCQYPIDQRTWQRVASQDQPCDAGAYELSAIAPPDQPPPPEPTPVPPVPTPPPGPAPTATPIPAGSVGAEEVKGTVLVRDPKTKKFVPFEAGLLKNGWEVDTRKGTIVIEDPAGGKAEFFDGIFKISQAGGITTLTLTEKLDCSTKGKARAAAKKPKSRKLWGDGKGKFRTKGSYSAATIRGTKWLVTDTCTTTTTKVTEGAVTVEDLVKKRKIVVRKGKTYVARAKK